MTTHGHSCSLGQVTSGKRLLAGRDAGGRKTTGVGGDDGGGGLRTATYSANRLNQHENRTVPGYVDIMGKANAWGDVTVNGNTAYHKGE